MRNPKISPDWLNTDLDELELNDLRKNGDQVLFLEAKDFTNFLETDPSQIKLIIDDQAKAVTLMNLKFDYEKLDSIKGKLNELYKQPESFEYQGTKEFFPFSTPELMGCKKLLQWRKNGFSLNLKEKNDCFEIEIFNS